jgi:N-acetylneuraminate synthase
MTYIIAELGSVHDGSLGNAIHLIGACVTAGADAVKLQDHRGEKVKGDPPWYRGHEQRGDYLKRTSFTQEQWIRIHSTCLAHEVDLVVSPFSVEAVALLEELPVDAYKIASGQVTNLEMLREIGSTGRRVYLSSGMTGYLELEAAVSALCYDAPDRDCEYTILQCTSAYPCPPETVGLNKVSEWLAREEGIVAPIGLSDHTLGFAASLAAIALGATVIERHVTFHRDMYGTDACNSLTIEEFARFVREVRDLDVMLANPVDKDTLASSPEMLRMREAFLEQP